MQNFSRYFLLLFLVGLTVLFVNMVKVFLLPLLLAAVFATLFYPMYSWFVSVFKNRRSISAFVCCLILLIGLLAPLYVMGNLVTHEAINFYQNAGQTFKEVIEKNESGLVGRIRNSNWFQKMGLEQVDWKSALRDGIGKAGSVAATIISRTSGGAIQAIATIFVTLFIMFYLFRDGPKVIAHLKYLVPLPEEYEDAMIKRFVAVSRATIKGTLLIGLTQSTLGAITLWIFGVDSPMLWWVVMIIASLIPVFGAWIVLHPAALIQILLGHVWQGVGIFLVTVLVISTIDNVMRPRLVGQHTGMHELIVFFSAFGGITMFGPLGVLVGPIIAAFFVTVLEIYSTEFKSHLETQIPKPSQDANLV